MNKKILVVDDDQAILESFEAILGEDFAVGFASSGQEAMQQIEKDRPLLLFLDIKMPYMSGIEVLQRIHSLELKTRVVIITALPQEKYEKIARKYPITGYIKKPFEVSEIEDIAKTTDH
ncbi:MAG: response regulator transcription factor [Desulfovibrionales bacterium]